MTGLVAGVVDTLTTKGRTMNAETKLSDMAFEHGVDGETELWRVMSFRTFNDKSFRNTNWFSTKAEAEAYAEWINDGRGKVLSIKQYRKVEQ